METETLYLRKEKPATFTVRDLGLITFQDALEIQQALFDQLLHKFCDVDCNPEKVPNENVLLLCEHYPVYTLGNSGFETNLLPAAQQSDAEIVRTNRGGDVTFHGPGQLVGYPILNLKQFHLGIQSYVHAIEEAVIRTLADFGIPSSRLRGATGVWLDADSPEKVRKICAIGIKSSRWITMHGFALNINTDLSYFENIIPCGIEDKGITSMKKELGSTISIEEVKEKISGHLHVALRNNKKQAF